MSRTCTALLAVAIAIGAACVPPAAREQVEDAQARPLQPTFSPTATETPTPSLPPSPTATPTSVDDPSPAATAEPTGDEESPTEPSTSPASPDRPDDPFRASAEVQDPTGDVDEPLLVDAPEYADLRAGSIEIDGDRVTLSVSFATETPETSDDDHTMNVASFYDVDGDGTVDYEVWANLSSTGWGTSWFDNGRKQALYGSDDEVEVEVTPAALVLTYPRSYLGDARTFRWALAAEWGTYEALTTGRMTSDRAPDDGRPARFPG